MSKRYSGKSFKDSSVMKKAKLTLKDIETYRSKSFNKDEFFYDYGKKTIKDKRKMGHFTVLKK